MHPLAYQRPTTTTSDGNFVQAEAIVAKLGIAQSLKRKYATLSDIQSTLWLPTVESKETKSEGTVFGHLKSTAKGDTHTVFIGNIVMTWEKFKQKVMPSAKCIEINVPNWGNFVALVTASHADAPPIIQWDTKLQRNPVSWYIYPTGSQSSTWNLHSGDWLAIDAITLKPCSWYGESKQHGEGVIFIIPGASDSRNIGLALFPSILKSELHSIRSSIEALSNCGKLETVDYPACGLMISQSSGESAKINLRVTSNVGVVAQYVLDRFD